MILNKIKNIGMEIENTIRGICLSELDSVFPEIANRALLSLTSVTSADIFEELSENDLPKQWCPDHQFGDSRFTLFLRDEFIIELNVWQSEFTSIHEHSFSGAFRVLSGQALEITYDYIIDSTIAKDVHLGRLEKKEVNLLRPGDQSKIHTKNEYIHNLVHLENPTCTLIIRTSFDHDEIKETKLSQLEYVDYLLAFNSFPYPEGNNKLHTAIQSVNIYSNLEEKVEDRLYLNILSSLNDDEVFHLITKTFRVKDWLQNGRVKELLDSRLSNRTNVIVNALLRDASKNNSFSFFRSKLLSRKTRTMLAALYCSQGKAELQSIFKMLFEESSIYEIASMTVKRLNQEAELFAKQSEQGLISAMTKLTEKNLDKEALEIKNNLEQGVFRAFAQP
jgi:hypothetical protein